MKITATPLNGLLVIEPHCYQDERGFFLETYQEARYREAGITDIFLQTINPVLSKAYFEACTFR